MNTLFSLEGKTALVTGASKGLGFSFAKGLAEAGATVIMNARGRELLSGSAERLRKTGAKIIEAPFDVSNEDEVKTGIIRALQKSGGIDILVNNAGIHRRAPLEEMTLEDWKKVVDVNLTSAFITAKALIEHFKSRGGGVIINITSLNAVGARPTIGNYCAAKGGLTMLTKSMATEWGKYGVRANAIGPGYFQTDLTQKLVDDPQFDAWVKSEVPLGRWGQPDELIGSAVFLASDAGSYINGHTIFVDGGWQASL